MVAQIIHEISSFVPTNVGGDFYFSKIRSPLCTMLVAGAQHTSMLHNIDLYSYSGAQCRYWKPTHTDAQMDGEISMPLTAKVGANKKIVICRCTFQPQVAVVGIFQYYAVCSLAVKESAALVFFHKKSQTINIFCASANIINKLIK